VGNASNIDEYIYIWRKIRLANDALYLALSEALSKYGCTREQFEVLFALERSPSGMTPALLSKRMFRKSNSVAGLLNRMEKLGFIRRYRSASGIRSTIILRTEKGKEIFDQAYDTFASVLSNITSQCSDDQLSSIKLYMQNLGKAAIRELKTYEIKSKRRSNKTVNSGGVS
jgi:DNA-binding MarR family transcriptional regulator